VPGLGIVIDRTYCCNAGGLTGTIIGALIGWGIPEERATLYESDLEKWRTVWVSAR
jgi:prolyl-tRNA editing enzyme YbaK/EbsC (Cys-tRNA(Pro) deacylase)